MWLDKLNTLKKQSGMSTKYIAEKMHRSERTISRFLSGETRIGIDEAREMVIIMGGSLDEILHESDFKLPTPEIEALKGEVASLLKTIEEISSQKLDLQAENHHLKETVRNLETEVDRLKLIIEHKDEIIELHNHYNKIKQGN